MPTCKNCTTDFPITEQGKTFYARIDVPTPTHCPDCRQQRRAAWRNERVFYSRKCSLCGKAMIAIYSEDPPRLASGEAGKPFTVYCLDCWWGDKWGGEEYGAAYDPQRSFFEQFKALQQLVPRINLYQKNNVNSDYTNHTDHAKNCYICADVGYGEELYYSKWIIKSADCVDSYQLEDCQLCYQSMYGVGNYNCNFTFLCYSCRDTDYLYDCVGCTDCFMSGNLRNKKFVFRSQQLSEADYRVARAKVDLGSYRQAAALFAEYRQLLAGSLHKFATIVRSQDCSGDYIDQGKNVRASFGIVDGEDCSYCYDSGWFKDTYDAFESAFDIQRQYETHACNRTTFSQFTTVSYDASNLRYCDLCHSNKNLFGCVGLRHKQFCILNKQYSEEEYQALVKHIIAKMTTDGEYGEFFPIALSPFGYNETSAQDDFPLTKEQALAKGWAWQDHLPGTFGKETVLAAALPDNITEAGDDLLQAVLACQTCKKNYKLIKQELEFYRRKNLSIPRSCPDCRYLERMSLKNPNRLHHRQCMCEQAGHGHAGRCPVEFETTYTPDRPERVYCEECYQKEIY
ncbi:hypothetical protein HY933_01375 [Candidatus Falkowbacteria bacterium]|nr:hypothetical protein [Candidatus Falkowbacteria bacterium]